MKALEAATSAAAALTVSSLCRVLVSFVGSGSGSNASSLSLPSGLWVSSTSKVGSWNCLAISCR